jgi:hypothetical protein
MALALLNLYNCYFLQACSKFSLFIPFSFLIGWQLSIRNCCEPFFLLLYTYNCQLLCFWQPALTLILLMWWLGWAPNSISIYIQQDATLHILFISGNCSTCFGWYFHPSSGAHTIVSTASGICHTVTAICRYRGKVGTGLSVLWMA